MPNSQNIPEIELLKNTLLERCGFLFSIDNRERNLLKSTEKRMKSCQISSYSAYLLHINQNPEEFQNLVDLLTINETYFFREPEHLNLVVNRLIPKLLASGRSEPIKIICAGCSSGEEPYSLAIMLDEKFGANSRNLFSIIGFDIDSTVIASARRGVYGNSSFRTIPDSLKKRYFTQHTEHTYAVGDVKNLVSFQVVNLLAKEYPSTLADADFIFYRNVSIYFPSNVQREIFTKLAAILVNGGSLFVSSTETIYHDLGILPLVTEGSVFFFRKGEEIIIEDRRTSVRKTENRPPTTTPNRKTDQNLLPHFQGEGRGGDGVSAELSNRYTNKTHPHPNLPLEGEGIKKLKVELRGGDPKKLFDNALQYANKGFYEQALPLLDEIIEKEPHFIKAAILKSSIFINESRFKEAAAICLETVKKEPLALEAYLILGMVARHNGDHETAHKRFREAVYINNSCWFAHYYLGEILYIQGEIRRSRQEFETTLKILTARETAADHGHDYFPLTFNTDQFIAIAKHKLSQLEGANL